MTEYRDLKDMERGLRKKWVLGGEVAYRLRKTLERDQLVFVSMLPEHITRPLDIKVLRTASDALRYITRGSRKELKVIVIPFGSVTIPAPSA